MAGGVIKYFGNLIHAESCDTLYPDDKTLLILQKLYRLVLPNTIQSLYCLLN